MIRSDAELQEHAQAELRCHPQIDDTDIAVSVRAGVVTLSGNVHHFFDKYRAEDAVQRIAGVLGVANNIRVRAPGGVSDPELARAAMAALRRQLPLCWQQIRAVVHQGRVTLEGTVEWIHQRTEAEQAVRELRGVVWIVNSIGLAPHPRPERQPHALLVRAALARSGICAAEIGVMIDGGQVILRGRVGNWEERSRAKRAVLSVAGVHHVRNELIVASPEAATPAVVGIDANGAK